MIRKAIRLEVVVRVSVQSERVSLEGVVCV